MDTLTTTAGRRRRAAAPVPFRLDLSRAAHRNALLASVFLVSAAGLIFEITLTRVFSLLFQYHFAFLAVSVAVMGLGIGAAIARLFPPAQLERALTGSLLALSLAFPLATLALAWIPTTSTILLHVAVALIPFTLAGYFVALAFANFASAGGLLYGADLIGAAVGVAAVLGLLTLWSAFSVVIALGAITGVAALALTWLNSDRRYTAGAAVATAASLVLLGLNQFTGLADFAPARLADYARDKTMLAVLGDDTQAARIVYTVWDPFARVDVVETNDATQKLVFADGGAGSYMLRFEGETQPIAEQKDALEFIPFTLRPGARTLILGAGAGRDVALALLAGSREITALEVNPAMVKATRRFAEFNGQIYDRPGVRLEIGDARTFVERSPEQYDLIYLNLVYSQAQPPASQALVESYIFTREAFRAYLSRLAPGGHLAIVAHNALEGSRAALTALQALEDMGTPVPQGLDRVALLMQYNVDPTQRFSILIVGQKDLSEDELDILTAGIQRVPDMQALFMPGGFELPFQPLRTGMSTIEQFDSEDTTYNLAPTSDDSPFFFKLDPGLPGPIQSALTAAISLAIALALIAVWPITAARSAAEAWEWLALVAYVALIGVGFMLIEIPLIQRFQLLLGQPMLAVVAVLGTMLLASGLGSLVSQRWPLPRLPQRVLIAALSVSGIALAYWWALPWIVRAALAAPLAPFFDGGLAGRLLLVVALTAVVSFPMGIPFPSALRLASGRPSHTLAALWGVNGVFSVLGSTLAMVMAMTWGFSWALLGGIAAYGALAVVVGLMARRSV